jgi:hypothetical protein
VMSEEQNVNSDDDAYKRKHVDHDAYVSLHVPIVLGSASREKAGCAEFSDRCSCGIGLKATRRPMSGCGARR